MTSQRTTRPKKRLTVRDVPVAALRNVVVTLELLTLAPCSDLRAFFRGNFVPGGRVVHVNVQPERDAQRKAQP